MVGLNQAMVLSEEERSRIKKSRREPEMNAEDLQQNWKEQGEDAFATVARWRVAHPPLSPTPATSKPTRQKTGRTEAQYRWGRHTFSPRLLKQADNAKKMKRTRGRKRNQGLHSSDIHSRIMLCSLHLFSENI
jgi:hypothetical protein